VPPLPHAAVASRQLAVTRRPADPADGLLPLSLACHRQLVEPQAHWQAACNDRWGRGVVPAGPAILGH
jgi:hypothetical protein